jgi:alpha-ketoglutarate-dependent taurine dioxygenase
MDIKPLDAGLGAEVFGLDVRTLNDDELAGFRRAAVDHGVVFVRDQALTDDEQLDLARRFGSLSVYPVLRIAGEERPLEFIEDTADDPPKADRWHSDLTWLPAPPMFGFLHMEVAPDTGGDTMWADTQGVYESFSPAFQEMLAALRVLHRVEPLSFDRFEERFGSDVGGRFRAEYADGVDHPLVRRHPESGRVALFLAGYWMDAIVGFDRDESDLLLNYLMERATSPAHTVRWPWQVDDLAVWDERRTMHIALGDHYPRHRKVRRCTVDGEVPVAVGR